MESTLLNKFYMMIKIRNSHTYFILKSILKDNGSLNSIKMVIKSFLALIRNAILKILGKIIIKKLL